VPVKRGQAASSPPGGKVCIGRRSPPNRAIATDADHNATKRQLVEKGDAVLDVVGKHEGWHVDVYDLNAPCQLPKAQSHVLRIYSIGCSRSRGLMA
jgi:hypothetical protein